MAEFARRGVMLVLASPSGAGKSSISRAIFAQDPNISLSVSVTTRAPPHRRDRRHATTTSSTCRRSSACAPTASCSRAPRCTAISTARRAPTSKRSSRQGRDILFDIDYQGTLQLLETCARRHGDDLHPAALDPRAAQAARAARAGQQGAPSRSGCKNARIEMEHCERVRLRARQRATSTRAARAGPLDPRRGAASSATASRRWTRFVQRSAEARSTAI